MASCFDIVEKMHEKTLNKITKKRNTEGFYAVPFYGFYTEPPCPQEKRIFLRILINIEMIFSEKILVGNCYAAFFAFDIFFIFLS